MTARTAANFEDILPGTVLAGKYRVEYVLGVGGMGMVFAARHLQLGELVAIKLLLPEVLGNSEVVSRFLAEARAAVKIKSEHVARVLDVDTLDSGQPFIVMEHLEGQDLASWLESEGPLPLALAAEFIIQACDALAEAHAAGIVHRDLKPANLFCIRRTDGLPAIKLLDFGISKAAAGSGASITRPALVMGSPRYMSPEQLESMGDVDARGDIWALGVTLYELVSGEPLFSADSIAGAILQIARLEPLSFRALPPEVLPGLRPILLSCLPVGRERRYQHVGELAQALAEFAPSRSRVTVERVLRVLATQGVSSGVPSERKATEPVRTRVSTGDSRRKQAWLKDVTPARPARKPWEFVAYGALLVVCVGLLSVGYRRLSSAETSLVSRVSAPGIGSMGLEAPTALPPPPRAIEPAPASNPPVETMDSSPRAGGSGVADVGKLSSGGSPPHSVPRSRAVRSSPLPKPVTHPKPSVSALIEDRQ